MGSRSNTRLRARTSAGSAITGLLLALAGCGSPDAVDLSTDPPGPWSRVSVSGEFSLELPPELAVEPERGVDSLYRVYRSDALVVSVDYGWYSNSLADIAGDELERKTIQVDGRSAAHVRYRDQAADSGLEYVVGLHVPDTGKGQVKLTLVARARSEHDRDRAERILRSLRFLYATPPAE